MPVRPIIDEQTYNCRHSGQHAHFTEPYAEFVAVLGEWYQKHLVPNFETNQTQTDAQNVQRNTERLLYNMSVTES